MAVDNDLFKELMRRFAAGVTLVTFNENDKFGGLTVSSFCSLSMNPPLVLICIDRKIVSHESLKNSDTFGINICNSEQGKLAWDFANSKVDKNELIKSLPHTLTDLGTPLLKDSLASMECKITERHDGGDHTIFIGQVENGNFDENSKPLLYYGSGLGEFNPN
jgi:flavin reductase (DIM6/NTAB) family NADH-FMN oxidoreductase RutF|tara:strand:+ start:39 stop:527 length:489 start_codon:yes stop_codon:yes gene_type:complete